MPHSIGRLSTSAPSHHDLFSAVFTPILPILSFRQQQASSTGGERMGAYAEHKASVVTGSVADLAGTFRFGIEEEYFLVDAETKAIALTVPEAVFAAAKSSTLGRGKGEFLQQQLEGQARPCRWRRTGTR